MAVLPTEVPTGVVVICLALRALEANETILAHRNEEYRIMNKESRDKEKALGKLWANAQGRYTNGTMSYHLVF